MKVVSPARLSTVLVIAFGIDLAFSTLARASTWVYEEKTDKMDGSLTKFARIESDNSMALSFPYSGTNRARLIIRQAKGSGLNVIFAIDKGQLICGYSDDCTIAVRFDDAQPVRFSATRPADHSSTARFINNERRFVELARKAKQIFVGVTVYQAGTQVREFSTPTPLTWELPKPTAPNTKDAQPDDLKTPWVL